MKIRSNSDIQLLLKYIVLFCFINYFLFVLVENKKKGFLKLLFYFISKNNF